MPNLHEGAAAAQEPFIPDLAMAVADELGIKGEVHTDFLIQGQAAGYLAMDLEREDFFTDGEIPVTADQARVVLRALEIHASGIRDDSLTNRTIFGAYLGGVLDLMATGQRRPELEEQ